MTWGLTSGAEKQFCSELQVSNPGSFLRLSQESRAGNTHRPAKNSTPLSLQAFLRDVQKKKKVTLVSHQNSKGPLFAFTVQKVLED